MSWSNCMPAPKCGKKRERRHGWRHEEKKWDDDCGRSKDWCKPEHHGWQRKERENCGW